jgi:hypothetical protein
MGCEKEREEIETMLRQYHEDFGAGLRTINSDELGRRLYYHSLKSPLCSCFDYWRRASSFHGRFYGLRIFGCKTTQFCATPREWLMTETPSIRKRLQRCENLSNSLGLN